MLFLYVPRRWAIKFSILEECHVSVRNTTTETPSRLHLVSSCHLHFNSSSHLKSLESCLSSCLLSLTLFLENLCSQRTQQVQSKATCRNQVLHCLEPARDLSDFNGTNVLICCIVLFVLSVFADVFADLKQEAPLNGANRRDRMRIRTELQDIHSISACFRLPGRCTLGDTKMSMQGVQKKPLLLSESLGADL